jgi:6-phosphofructokinase 2
MQDLRSILTVTMNPALDMSTSAPDVHPGSKLRCTAPTYEPGGGGINVSRAIQHLGGTSRAILALGGQTGDRLAQLLEAEQIPVIRVDLPGDTRQGIAVTDEGSGEQFRFVLPGPAWSSADVDRLRQVIFGSALPGGHVVISGSQPPGCPANLGRTLSEGLCERGVKVILDSSGAPLTEAASGKANGPFVLRMDSEEADGLARRPLETREDTAEFAELLAARGAATHVVIARGPDGSILAGPDGVWHAAAADVPVVSKIGAGDSFVGGMTFALSQGASLPEALQRGAAAASAAVMTAGTQLCTKADAEALLSQTPLTRM